MEKVLSSLTATNLKKISQACGTKLVGRKSEVIHALKRNASLLNATIEKPIRLISLDPGVVNLGVTKMSIPAAQNINAVPTVEQCYRDSIHIDSKSSNPEFAEATVDFLSRILRGSDSVDFVLIEQQRSRSSGGPSIPTAILRNNVLEGMLFAVIQASYPCTRALSIPPKSVVNYWSKVDQSVNEKNVKPRRTYAMSKAIRRDLIGEWLNDGSNLHFSDPQILSRLRSLQGKRDDVHDSLVQAMTWAEWRINTYKLMETIKCSRSPSFSSFEFIRPCG